MQLYNALNLCLNEKEAISFVGGGGKTTSIKTLAIELKERELSVLITTSTMIFEPENKDYDLLFLENLPIDYSPIKGSITIIGQEIKNGKLIGLPTNKIDEIIKRDIFDYILIEADGSKRKPIKAPDSYEPVIPNLTTVTIGVIGIHAIGCKIDEDMVHRPELLKELLSVGENHIIDSKDIVNLALHPNGLFKSSKGENILLLNKVKDLREISIGVEIREKLIHSNIHIVIADILNKIYY